MPAQSDRNERKLVSVFVPCFNEAGNLEELKRRLLAVLDGMPQYDYEVVISDNCSTDGSRDILRRFAREDERFKIIFNLKNFGPGPSGAHGFFQTTGNATVTLAADLQDPPELIPQFIELWERGSKVVWGRNPQTDEKKGMFAVRSLYYKVMGRAVKEDRYAHVSGFGLYDKEVVDRLMAEGKPNPNFRYSVVAFGYEAALVDYVKPMRVAGTSSYNLWRYLDEAVHSFTGATRAPMRVMVVASPMVALVAFIGGIIALCLAIAWSNLFALIIAVLLIICGFGAVIVFCIGLVGEYVGLVLDWTSKGPLVYEEERLNFKDDLL
jgi:glycosyltransferase involved in cell wall biosynthesis